MSDWNPVRPVLVLASGRSQHTHMLEEARLVSSCLSLPSRARPLFSRLLLSVGVSVYTLQNVELGDTWSLSKGKERERRREAGRAREREREINHIFQTAPGLVA